MKAIWKPRNTTPESDSRSLHRQLTNGGCDEMGDILLTTFSNAFSWKCLNYYHCNPDSKVHGTNMGPTWVLSAPDAPHVGPMNLAIKEFTAVCSWGFGWERKNLLQVIVWHWTGNKLLSESMMTSLLMHISRVSWRKGPICHAYGSFWQDTIDMCCSSLDMLNIYQWLCARLQ